MKKLVLLPLVIALSGCAAIEAFQMAKFDSAEYTLITKISSISEIGNAECSDPIKMKSTAASLLLTSTEFKNHAIDIPNNDESIRISNSIYEIVKSLSDRYGSDNKVSIPYCNNKMTIIERAAKTAKSAIGNKPK